MNKTQIIESIARASANSDRSLAEQEMPTGNFRRNHLEVPPVNPESATMAGRIFAVALNGAARELPEAPSPDLFRFIHQSATDYHLAMLGSLALPEVATHIIAAHRSAVSRLQEHAAAHFMHYPAPHDPIADPQATL